MKLLGKIKIYEISKETGLTSKEIIDKANELGIEVKTHMSGVDENEAKKIKETPEIETLSEPLETLDIMPSESLDTPSELFNDPLKNQNSFCLALLF